MVRHLTVSALNVPLRVQTLPLDVFTILAGLESIALDLGLPLDVLDALIEQFYAL